jgi:hypothetical protein
MNERKRVTLADFARAVQETNPFRLTRISRPEELRGDVPDIHGSEFRKLLRRIEEARQGAASGVMLMGTVGGGKSHLLARLCRWAHEQKAVAPVFLHNLQASPERIARYLLKATIYSLSGLQGKGLSQVLGTEELDAEILGVLRAYVELSGVPDQEDLVSTAAEWLSGEEVDEDQAAQLTALAGRAIPLRLPDAASVERVIVLVAKVLAADGRALLLCIDQIDNLGEELVAALTAFLHALLDHASHLLVICSGVSHTMIQLREDMVIAPAAWDRVAEHVIKLLEVPPEQACMMVEARLAEFVAPFAHLKGVAAARKADPLFPLSRAWFDQRFEGLQFRPRDVMLWSRDAWEDIQAELAQTPIGRWIETRKPEAPQPRAPERPLEDAIREVVRLKVEERCAERLLNPSSLPPDADNLAMLIRGLLKTCTGWPGYSLMSAQTPTAPKRGVRSFDLLVKERTPQGGEALTGVLCIPGGHGNASTAALKRVQDDPQPLDHILLVSDKRRMFKPGPKGAEIYSALNQSRERHFAHLGLDLAEVAQLDALVSVLGLARVGDLEVEHPRGVARAVTEAEAAAAMHHLDLFRSHQILRELLTEEARAEVPQRPAPPLDESAVRTLIAGFLSWRMGASAAEVARKAAQDHQIQEVGPLLQQVISVADEMHREGVIRVSAQDDDRYLLWLGTAA